MNNLIQKLGEVFHRKWREGGRKEQGLDGLWYNKETEAKEEMGESGLG